ncbi:hypothetical protein Tco_0842803, partial [Tanacetum coccineum]
VGTLDTIKFLKKPCITSFMKPINFTPPPTPPLHLHLPPPTSSSMIVTPSTSKSTTTKPLYHRMPPLFEGHCTAISLFRPSSSQLKIPVYPEVRDPRDPWAFKEEIMLEDPIAANVSRAKKKKKCRVVCRTHGIGSAHHARLDGVHVSVPTVIPQGLQILLKDADVQTKLPEDGASPRLIRSKSLPAMYNLD